ncbi:MAG: cytochrome c oxidase assembly protein [Acidobacteriaceae bacterium]
MRPSLAEAIARSWTLPLWPTLGVLALGVLYWRGWRLARTTRRRELPAWRAACFFGGLLSLWLALASPLDALDPFLLVAHMTQHILLMSVAPPLLLLGNPVVPVLRGLPRSFVREELAPWMHSRALDWMRRVFTSATFGWVALDAAVVLWHVPAAYELALRSNFWHQAEHGCFFFAAVAFWWYVVRPWPNRIRSPQWTIIPYVFFSHMVLFFVGLVIAFDSEVIYPSYARVPRLFGISAMTDQALAGGEMIFVGLLVIVAALTPVLVQMVSEKRPGTASVSAAGAAASAGIGARRPFDWLHAPVAGPALRLHNGRRVLQGLSFVLIAAVIVDGLFGVQVGGMNLAGAAVWNIVRPLSLVLLLFATNVFCMACPFTLPREVFRRFGIPQLRWPERLSSKWPAVALMVLFFWAYEQFALWNSPRATALLLLGYVVAATAINSVFRGASFCKYLCPVGQFNFVASIFAPLELGARSQEVCTSCSTHDCVRGNETQRGCELKLYVPNKVGNLDCTLCMDCVHACPHDNVAVTVQSPLRELTRDPVRSSLGRISARPDVAALILVVVFSSFANAGVMIAPVARVLDDFRQRHPWAGGWAVSLVGTCVFTAVLLLLYLGAAKLMQVLAARQTAGGPQALRTVFCRFALALLPLGLSIWLGHLAFHLAGSWSAIPAVGQHLWAQVAPVHAAARDAGAMRRVMGAHSMQAASSSSMFSPLLGANGVNLFDLQVWVLNLGLFVSWYAGGRLIREMAKSAGRAWWMGAVWAVSSSAPYAVAVWIFTQPMFMRGMTM